LAGYWERIGIKSRLIPVDYAAFRKKWVDKQIPGNPGHYKHRQPWVGTFALLKKQAYGPSVMTTVKDPTSDAWIQEILTATDESKAFELMRNDFKQFRSEHYVVPLFNIHSPYAASKKATGWDIGTVMYDFNLDELARAK
jgi:ABC-type transport system substrate-binding protein